ncbi:alpha-galactosidase [Paenibacillus qinlingensis]|uniref:Alpha-galactosidase n=1 Tax=Paenibacillus qinlingensis TaxID=1837343 RepID=A0ABU1NT83_9BACL|nr:alpha-galactosidase [Paenibacillus qinlingensis]MDR6550072.1 alpha-galactosidase [Paenibacillus qinlingensis]
MSIQYLEQQKLWILSTKESDYVIQVSPKGQLLHRYWGEKQQLFDYEHENGGQHWIGTSHTDSSKDEIMPWGGLRFTEPGLKITFADHSRDLCHIYDSYQITNRNLLTIRLVDSQQQLHVLLHYNLIAEQDLIERNVEIINASHESVTLEQVMGAVWHLPVYPQYQFTYLTGHWGGEFQVRREFLQEGKKVLESRCGLSGHLYNPWFAVDFGDAAEEHGDVYFGAIAYSGNWKLVAERYMRQSLQITAGLNDFDFAWTLGSGESFSSPVCVAGYTKHGYGQASRNMHRYQEKYLLRQADQIRPVMYNSWYSTHFDISVDSQKLLADKAAAMGTEMFVMDDGWFGPSRTNRSKLGDWVADPSKFPDGLTPLIDHVKSLGMKFGLWVEPENVGPDSDVYREHPDWIFHFPNRERTHLNKEFTLNLAREDVRDHLISRLDNLLATHDISYVKWDMNRYISEPGWHDAPREHHKEVWVRYVQGLYGIIETLRDRHPRVMFEACASGGGRVDLGMMKYVEQFWTSDDTDGFDRLSIQEGYSYGYTPKAMMCWVAPAARIRPRSTSIRYRFHVAMMGSLGISLDLSKLTEAEFAECRSYIAQYKNIRGTVQEGDLYRLMPTNSPEGTAAVQYVNQDRNQVVLFAFRHSMRFVHSVYPIRLKGLNPQAVYSCESLKLERSGASLMATGVQLELKGDFDSELVVFQKMQ